MGVAADLGYRIPTPNPVQRGLQGLASTRPGAWVFSQTLRHLDDVVGRVSGGRTSAPEVLAGLPVLELTTTGRKTGVHRTSPLIGVPYGDSLALLGTNFGQPPTPAWVLNLEADPRGTVRHHSARVDVVARPATDEEHAAVLDASARVYGGYLRYQQRISDAAGGGRRLRIFLLEPA
ncbi:MAG: nitroreductase family deazaflavin-dependent oxidoreductase [Nocardioides sp.]|nr:nitroreductase family deazaflavin-dependent oxidoreductase [Nocardioides sp.]